MSFFQMVATRLSCEHCLDRYMGGTSAIFYQRSLATCGNVIHSDQ